MKRFVLINAQGEPLDSAEPGQMGGHRRSRIYGRLDCPAALRAIARGGYVAHRVFFADETTARAAGYRPCAVCLPLAYREWKKASSLRLGQLKNLLNSHQSGLVLHR
ncbi:metal-binding protein [Pseudomonas sp. FW306-02-F02-AA]|uniref:Ada metal-binding domain-containing protein n=1 Tax=Pseudomonas sp. FW306-2-11AD TaxID=2070665 RepID=UPI0009C1451E|nr:MULTISPECIES: Ada metal-binding domain-containing protein [unclassified Pseudomonas]PMZ03077.1 metal-binding protein [Pseudomonas sp. FW306-02-F02-AB]PMZ12135.1 metal-binding protein [Pseudomonas sp. FW306-02-H06C]PMZ14486.1 metal-binding protein [Pseudomonas sp. FW306-02-F02-AA]PMZ20527.1 metal-binding protein [Pseudomonas sp. FW306-02-F08-AA]PMZ26909.1 metal-binding protein [Pseudomonas sp. FW306-02-F04-BA]